jgi:hypothetical protein
MAEQGHTGIIPALAEAHGAFIHAVTAPRAGTVRDTAEAEGEWRRSLVGAVRRVAGTPSTAPDEPRVDPCTQPFAGLITVAQLPAPTPNPAPAPVELVEPDEHTTWWPRDLGPVLAGEHTDPEPAVLARGDKKCLFYAGKINGILGESESGKTWVLLAAVVQEVTAGRPVLYIDFEDTDTGIIARLRALGLTDEQLSPEAGLFTYIAPEESLHALANADLTEVLGSRRYSLIGLDGVNAAMTLLGLDLISNTDATRFAQTILRPLARTDAAVVAVDHVPKDEEKRGKGGIGAQAKRAMVTGCALTVSVIAPFGRGQTGKLKLVVDKDRPGYVRGIAAYAKNVGIVMLDSDTITGAVSISIEPPDTRPLDEREPFRPTGVMSKVSRYLANTEGDLSTRQLEEAIEGRSVTIRAALDALVAGGYVTRHAGPTRSTLHHHVTLYREENDLISEDDEK